MPWRYHRTPILKGEHTYLRVTLFTCVYSCYLCMSLVLAGIYRLPKLARARTVHLCVTREGFSFASKLAKTCVHGCTNAIHVILNVVTVHMSIKFKSSCTIIINVPKKTPMLHFSRPLLATYINKGYTKLHTCINQLHRVNSSLFHFALFLNTLITSASTLYEGRN